MNLADREPDTGVLHIGLKLREKRTDIGGIDDLQQPVQQLPPLAQAVVRPAGIVDNCARQRRCQSPYDFRLPEKNWAISNDRRLGGIEHAPNFADRFRVHLSDVPSAALDRIGCAMDFACLSTAFAFETERRSRQYRCVFHAVSSRYANAGILARGRQDHLDQRAIVRRQCAGNRARVPRASPPAAAVGMIIGAGIAVILLIVFTASSQTLMVLPYLKLAGGLALLAIAAKPWCRRMAAMMSSRARAFGMRCGLS